MNTRTTQVQGAQVEDLKTELLDQLCSGDGWHHWAASTPEDMPGKRRDRSEANRDALNFARSLVIVKGK